MEYNQLVLILLFVLVLGLLVLIVLQFSAKKNNGNQAILDRFQEELQKLDRSTRDEFVRNREESQKSAQANRDELKAALTDNRKEQQASLKSFEDAFKQSVQDFNELQKRKFDELLLQQDKIRKETEEKLGSVRETVEKKLTSIQEDNEKRLEKMRQTVDEKLHETLEKRLNDSFKLVSERLEAVQKGLGDMQTLAKGVGDLKQVLSNVKTRGTLGEIQLANILEQIMAPEQYEANVATKKGSSNFVEFAIKLPGDERGSSFVYLPIDAKFPQEDYIRLQEARDLGDPISIELHTKSLNKSIKLFAKDIRNKYIDPPNTTDFGIMFLPVEGLFAEVVRQPLLFEELQREYKITVTGPTTLAAMLNSLQMGFRTLAIQKRSSEVWDTLSAVKTEFGKFGEVIEKAQKKLEGANKDLEDLVGVRSRQIERKLRGVELMSREDAEKLLGEE
ncbi:MAG: DNA recombination protein RmuC [Flavobacteriales bacterium]|nr:DNA recombination protein RmuC [Flavobacteriales bacterium]